MFNGVLLVLILDRRKTRLSVSFSFMLFSNLTTSHFPFTTNSELVCAQEIQNVSVLTYPYSAKKNLP